MRNRDGQPVNISHNNETGEWQWAITCDDAWWMDAFPTKDEAVAHCNAMGWLIAFISANDKGDGSSDTNTQPTR
jgi:hypothetical protein